MPVIAHATLPCQQERQHLISDSTKWVRQPCLAYEVHGGGDHQSDAETQSEGVHARAV